MSHKTKTPTPTPRAERAIQLLKRKGFSLEKPLEQYPAWYYPTIGKKVFAELVTLGWARLDPQNPLNGLTNFTVNVLKRVLPPRILREGTKADVLAELQRRGFSQDSRGGRLDGKSMPYCGRNTFVEICNWAGWSDAALVRRRKLLDGYVARLRAALREAQAEHGPQAARGIAEVLAPLLADAAAFKAGRNLADDAD